MISRAWIEEVFDGDGGNNSWDQLFSLDIKIANGGKTWGSWFNQPTGQFYRVAVDNDFPYRIYSGQQDSGTVSIASRSDYGRISFRDWNPIGADERDGDVPDPQDSNIVYGAGLGGRITRWDARTAQAQNVSPWPVSSYAENPREVE